MFEAAATPRLPLTEWAMKYRRIVVGPEPGPWNPANASISLEPMAALSDRWVEIVTLCAPAQLMKSELAITTAVWMEANGEDVLFYEPDRILLRDFMIGCIRPALHQVGGLVDESAKLKPGEKKRDRALATQLAGGGTIRGLSPGMKTGRSSYSAPLVVLDEVDKMCDLTMFTVGKSRTTAYQSDACVIAVSPPTMDEHGTPPAKREQA